MGNNIKITTNYYTENENNGKVLVKNEDVSSPKKTTIIKVNIKELESYTLDEKEIEEIKNNFYKDLDFCLLDNGLNGVDECMGLFRNNTSVLDKFKIVKSNNTCLSWFFRPGMVVDPKDHNVFLKNFDKPLYGKKCRLVYQDFNYDDNNLKRCCFTDNKKNCNANLINDYKTNHCNIIMQKECLEDPSNKKCIRWLERSYSIDRDDDVAFKLYSEICSKNFDSKYCEYFCMNSRKNNNDYRSNYCDVSLKKWCEANSNDSRCNCFLTKNELIPNVEEFIGPKECWLKDCSAQFNNQWLTTEQLNKRATCKLISCNISIDELTLNENSKAEFINNCINGTSVSVDSSKIYKEDPNNNNTIDLINSPGVLFYPELIFICLILLLISFILK